MKAKCILGLIIFSLSVGCERTEETAVGSQARPAQAAITDSVSQKNIVQVALDSKDHTTLVAALKTAELVDPLANPGPFTVFAPTNAAFNKLPAGTVEGLLKPEKKKDLQHILESHVFIGVLKEAALKDGLVLSQASGENVTVSVKDGKISVGGAQVIASIPVSNGVIHIVDAVILPAAK